MEDGGNMYVDEKEGRHLSDTEAPLNFCTQTSIAKSIVTICFLEPSHLTSFADCCYMCIRASRIRKNVLTLLS